MNLYKIIECENCKISIHFDDYEKHKTLCNKNTDTMIDMLKAQIENDLFTKLADFKKSIFRSENYNIRQLSSYDVDIGVKAYCITLVDGCPNIFLVGCSDSNIYLYNIEPEFQRQMEFKEHKALVRHIVCLPSKRFASSSDDKTIKIWTRNKNASLYTINTQGAFCLLTVGMFSPDLLISGGIEGEVGVWNINDIENIKQVGTFKHEDCVRALCHMTKVQPYDLFLSGGKDGVINLWNISTNELVLTYLGHKSWVNDLVEYKDEYFISCSSDHTIKQWSLSQPRCLRTFTQDSYIHRLILCDSNTLLSTSENKKLTIYDLDTEEIVKEYTTRTLLSRIIIQPATKYKFFACNGYNNTLKIISNEL
jgi:WD40 repeat protein